MGEGGGVGIEEAGGRGEIGRSGTGDGQAGGGGEAVGGKPGKGEQETEREVGERLVIVTANIGGASQRQQQAADARALGAYRGDGPVRRPDK